MIEFFRYLHHIDKDITLAINSVHCPLSDQIWRIFSDKEIWFVMYLIVAFFLFRNLGWKRGIVATLTIILTITCCDQLANFTKAYFERLRPCCDLDMIRAGHRLIVWSGILEYGFYSAHAANALGFAVSSYLLFRNDKSRSYKIYGICIIAWGLLVGFSRIFVGRHFFGDVMVGFAVGTIIPLVLCKLASIVMKKDWFTK